MATLTYSYDIDANIKMNFVTDDVAVTTSVQIIRKSDSAVLATITLDQLEGMMSNYGAWNSVRQNKRFLSFTKV